MSTSRQNRLNGQTENDNFLDEINAPVEVVEQVNETPAPPLYEMTHDDYFNAMEQAHAVELTGEMLTHKNMEIGKPYNYLWTGYTTINDKVTNEPRKAVALVDKDKNSFICASVVVLSALEKIEAEVNFSFPVPVRFISEGMKEGKTNKYWNVKVYRL
jgi:hypothetical protein